MNAMNTLPIVLVCSMLHVQGDYCLASHWNKENLDVFEAKIEESEKAGSRWELNPGHLACAASALPLSYDNWTTTSPASGSWVCVF